MRLTVFILIIVIVVSAVLPLSSSSPRGGYSVTFTETGLSRGVEWTVSLNGYNQSSYGNITFLEPNGTYVFYIHPVSGYRTDKYTFDVNVSGSNVIEHVAWSRVFYNVSFDEHGLAPGTLWKVLVKSSSYAATNSSSSSSIIFPLVNGTYSYSISEISGYSLPSSTGNFTVNGSAQKISIYFIVTMNVTFLESGLPSGTVWSVTLGNRTYYSTSRFLYINISNGSGPFEYHIHVPANYYVSPSQGVLSPSNSFIFVTVGSYLPWEVLIAVVAVLAVLSFLLTRRRRKRDKGKS